MCRIPGLEKLLFFVITLVSTYRAPTVFSGLKSPRQQHSQDSGADLITHRPPLLGTIWGSLPLPPSWCQSHQNMQTEWVFGVEVPGVGRRTAKGKEMQQHARWVPGAPQRQVPQGLPRKATLVAVVLG